MEERTSQRAAPPLAAIKSQYCASIPMNPSNETKHQKWRIYRSKKQREPASSADVHPSSGTANPFSLADLQRSAKQSNVAGKYKRQRGNDQNRPNRHDNPRVCGRRRNLDQRVCENAREPARTQRKEK